MSGFHLCSNYFHGRKIEHDNKGLWRVPLFAFYSGCTILEESEFLDFTLTRSGYGLFNISFVSPKSRLNSYARIRHFLALITVCPLPSNLLTMIFASRFLPISFSSFSNTGVTRKNLSFYNYGKSYPPPVGIS